MSSLILLFLALFIITLFCLMVSKINLVTPEICFTVPFLISVTYAFYFADMWDLTLAGDTLAILIGGITLFIAVSLFTGYIYKRAHPMETKRINQPFANQDPQLDLIKVSTSELIIALIFQGAVLLLCIRFLLSLISGGLGVAMYYFRHSNLFTDNKIYMPGYLSKARIISMASGYVFSYILINNYLYKEKNTLNFILLAVNCVLSVANGTIMGGRGAAVIFLFAAAVQLYILKSRKENWQNRLKLKTVLLSLILGSIGIWLFQVSTTWIGREMNHSFSEYIAIYLSAELKNLDIFVREKIPGAGPQRCQTPIYLINYLSSKGILPEAWKHELDIPFHRIHGHKLGNVATTFYAFYYDAGHLGVIIYTAIMAFVSQILYRKSIRKREKDRGCVNLSIVLYSYAVFCLLFSFFSNKFYEIIFNPNFLYSLFTWWLMKQFFGKKKIRFK